MGPSKYPFLLLPMLLVALVARSTVFALSIGAVLDTNSRIGREQKIAIEVAARRFNASSQPILLTISELKSTDTLQAGYDAQLLIQQGAEVMVSTATWPQVLSISGISEGPNIPTISLTPSTVFAMPLLVQMSYPDDTLVKCLARFVASYNWRRVIIVYEDDDYGTVSGTSLLLALELQKVGIQLDYSAVFPPMDSISDKKSTVRAELNRMSKHLSTVYIVLRSSENLTVTLFQEATALGMMEQGSSWICGPDVATLLDSTLNSSFILNYMQGVIAVEPYVKQSTSEYVMFYSDFQKAFKDEYEKIGEMVFSPGVHASRAYDVVQAITLAENKAKLNNKSLVDNLLSINFTGLSGSVWPIIGNVEVAGGYSAFRVINVVGKSYKEIGLWLDGFGFYNNESQLNSQGSTLLQQLNVVFWPGGTRNPPGGLKRLKIGVPENSIWDGFVKVEYDNRTENLKLVSGFCIDVFTAAINRLNSLILYEFVPFKIRGNFTYDHLVDELYLKNIDIAIGDLTTTSSRSEKVSFTQPFVTSGLAMIIPMKHNNASMMLTKPFTPLLWITIFTLLFYYFGAVWYLERNHEKADEDFHGPWYRQIGATFWIIGNTIFQNHGDKVGNFYTKTVIISWLLVVLIVSNCFTANLSSILVTERLKSVVDKSVAGCDGAPFVISYLENVLNYKPENIVRITDQDDYPVAFQKKSITSAYLESPYVRVFLSKHNDYAVYGETQMLGGFAFALQKGDPMTADLSKEILTLAEDGTIKKLESKWFNVSLSNFGTTTNSVERQSLGLDVFWSLFVFSFGVSLIILAIFVIENRATARKKNKKQKRVAPSLEEDEIVSVYRIEEEHVRLDVHNLP
ncbi:glutamate receptor 2.7-like protein [Carex littledalei]|uniref:Glutamate receptor 2.7-like protein n=1 Tax=Carex littledalei TaxID=544730 RepID=A0A833R9I0_9POAL|nr:glutamate receptor 2.7-like protein [Carex littledalei]